jgi:hypothetical protein
MKIRRFDRYTTPFLTGNPISRLHAELEDLVRLRYVNEALSEAISEI